MSTLFELTDEMAFVMQVLESEDDEWTRDQLVAFLEKEEEKLAAKIDGYVWAYREYEGKAKARRAEAAHLTEMARADENRGERLKETIKFVSERLGRKKFEGNIRAITVSDGGVAIEILDEGAIPKEFKEEVVTTKVNKKGLRDHFVEYGEIVPGIEVRRITSVRFR